MSKNKKKALGLSTTIFISRIAGALFGLLLALLFAVVKINRTKVLFHVHRLEEYYGKR